MKNQITVNKGAPLWDAVTLLFGDEGAEAVTHVATALLKAKNQGHQEGFDVGYDAGEEDGYHDGHIDGFGEGYKSAHEVFYSPVALAQPDLSPDAVAQTLEGPMPLLTDEAA